MTLPIINTDLVLLDVDAGADKEAVIGQLVNRLADAGRTTDSEGLIAAAMAREAQSATGLPGGIAIRTAGRRTSTPPRSVSLACSPRSTSAHPTARPTSPS